MIFYNLENNEVFHKIRIETPIRQVDFTRDNTLLTILDENNTVSFYNPFDKKALGSKTCKIFCV